MIIQYDDNSGRFVADCPYREKDIAKSAGFRWDPEQKHWYTTNKMIAARLLKFADESCRAKLEKASKELERARQASRATDAELSIPAPEGLAYLPFQKAGITFGINRPRVLIADEMGLGKTIQALGIINADSTIKNVLVVVPASLRINWHREAQKWLARTFEFFVAEKAVAIPSDKTFVIVSYDLCRNRKAHTSLLSRKWDLLICDEAHKVKNYKAQQTKAVLGAREKRWPPTPASKGLVHQAKRNVMLSGTPLWNRPAELYGILHALDPETWPSFYGFANRYCNPNNIEWYEPDGASHLDELQDRLRTTIMICRQKKEVLKELPPKRRQIIELPAQGTLSVIKREKRAWRKHEIVLEELRARVELAKAADNTKEYKRAVDELREGTRVSFGEISKVRHETALAKLPLVIEHLSDVLEAEGKVLCFCHHLDVAAKLAEAFRDISVTVTGKTRKRDQQVDRFRDDHNCRLFIGSITAAGTGLNLQVASHVIFAELDWVPAQISQAEDRCHRIGQKDSVLVQHLVLEGSLDAAMARTIVKKQDIIEQVLHLKVDPKELEMPVLPALEPVTFSVRRSQIAKEAKQISTEQIEAVHQALSTLAAVCDGAQSLDQVGFSKIDARIGHSLAAVCVLTPKQAVLGRRIVLKYHRQLDSELLELLAEKDAL